MPHSAPERRSSSPASRTPYCPTLPLPPFRDVREECNGEGGKPPPAEPQNPPPPRGGVPHPPKAPPPSALPKVNNHWNERAGICYTAIHRYILACNLSDQLPWCHRPSPPRRPPRPKPRPRRPPPTAPRPPHGILRPGTSAPPLSIRTAAQIRPRCPHQFRGHTLGRVRAAGVAPPPIRPYFSAQNTNFNFLTNRNTANLCVRQIVFSVRKLPNYQYIGTPPTP